ncbi:MAG: IS110 family transposase [Desulfuromonadaceae bacterium]|nr:IS110 family transposase [Desulfuromonadaceae bacterium]
MSIVSAGIDVSAKKIDVVIRVDGKNSKAKQFSQSAAGYQALSKHLSKAKPAWVVLEATGVYYVDLAIALCQAGLPVCVINPLSTHHFAKAKLNHAKTDATDAALLAEYGQVMQPRHWVVPSQELLHLRGLGRHINRLVHSRARAKNRLHALSSTQTTLKALIRDEEQGIRQLDKRIEKLRTAAHELLNSMPTLKASFDTLCTAVGVGENSALSILAEISILPSHLKAKQVSRQAGLDVQVSQSGSSVHKPGRMSKAGNAYLRTALFYPAMSAARHDPNARVFYDKLVERGKKKKQALVAIMRKYLTGLWACYLSGENFDSSKLFNTELLKMA